MKKIITKKSFQLFAKLFFVMIGLFFVFQSCKKDQPTTEDQGYSYFPNNIGHYCIYDVDSTVYSDFFHDTVEYKYQIKEVIQSYFTDNQGRQAMRVERYKRPFIDTVPYDSLPWTISRVWAFTLTNITGEKTEENERYVRLTFVPRVGKTWDGNEFNTLGEWDYKYLSVDQPYSINNMNFDSTLNVQQLLDTNLLNYQIYSERYARHVGMIEKEVVDVNGGDSLHGSVLNHIFYGVIYSIKLVDWGN